MKIFIIAVGSSEIFGFTRIVKAFSKEEKAEEFRSLAQEKADEIWERYAVKHEVIRPGENSIDPKIRLIDGYTKYEIKEIDLD